MKIIFASLLFAFISTQLMAQTQVDTGFIKVAPTSINGFPEAEQKKISEALVIIEAVLNSEEFKEKVVNYKAGPDGFGYTNNRKMNNAQVYKFLLNGKELIGGENTLGEMNFDLKRYWSSWFDRKVIGYTNPGKTNIIHANGRKYVSYQPHQMASNITHEWIHLMGFYHDNASDHDSVPYAVGYMIRDLAKKFAKQGFLD